MAAYAAVVSLMYSINQIQNHHHPPIFLDKNQVQSITQNLIFLQDFLEHYSLHFGYTKEANPLEMRIADAIESHIFDQIHVGSIYHAKRLNPIGCHEHLQRVINEMDSIKKEMIKIKEERQRNLTPPPSSSRSLSAASIGQNPIVGVDDAKLELMDKLIGRNNRQIIAIVGMAGIGKTTLAKYIYQDRVVVRNFDILAWVTITQGYRNREIISLILKQGGEDLSENENDEEDEYELEDRLHQLLWGRRYLIILDDIWDVKVWEQLRRYFPDNQNGSRIVLTTRMSNLHLSDSNYVLKMGFLDEDNSWILFSKIVFGDEGSCPLELEEIGKEIIVESCLGLPLSIVVVGGLLARSEHTLEYWEYIAENLNSIVNSEDDENCLKLLHLSYSELPVYLKPCFLYSGVCSQDRSIRVSELVDLWVAEGFLKPKCGKSSEEVADEYLKELINRNLISIQQLESTGNIKYCSIHDLLRDLCFREAQKESFISVPSQELSSQRRVVIPHKTSRDSVLDALPFMSLARSLICDSKRMPPLHYFRLMRIMLCRKLDYSDCLKDLFKLVNLRYLVLNAPWESKIPSSIYLLWNLHTLIVHIGEEESGPFDIWNMSQLRHLEFGKGLYLADPPDDDVVLEKLQVLGTVINYKWSDEVIKRIPNIKELKVDYYHDSIENGWRDYCLNNLGRLDKLESLHCKLVGSRANDIQHNLTLLTFPCSLKKLSLNVWHVHWEETLLEMIGSLPRLEKLKLIGASFKGCGWETVEGQFRRLKFLQIEGCKDMKFWTAESSHFPRLERLVLVKLRELNEIPMEIGEIESLKSIKLVWCSNSCIISSTRIIEEQELYGEVSVQVQVTTWDFSQKQELESLEVGPNFQFT